MTMLYSANAARPVSALARPLLLLHRVPSKATRFVRLDSFPTYRGIELSMADQEEWDRPEWFHASPSRSRTGHLVAACIPSPRLDGSMARWLDGSMARWLDGSMANGQHIKPGGIAGGIARHLDRPNPHASCISEDHAEDSLPPVMRSPRFNEVQRSQLKPRTAGLFASIGVHRGALTAGAKRGNGWGHKTAFVGSPSVCSPACL